MDKKTLREMKKKRKELYIFLAIAFPILLMVACIIYYFVPSLVNNQIVVIAIIVGVGGFMYLGFEIIIMKREKAKRESPKKFDPFADE